MPLLIQLPMNASEKAAEDSSSAWLPANRIGDQDEVSDSWLMPGTVLALCNHLGSGSEHRRFLSAPFALPAFPSFLFPVILSD